ncbi:MAG: hypothetical protein M3362_24515 [Acidobacteriota bacterium]|nr:hypothetical protein [Acidobacteriota bacterium]
MKSVSSFKSARPATTLLLTLLLTFSPATESLSFAQSQRLAAESTAGANEKTGPLFRLERLPVAGGAELLTIFGRLDGLSRDGNQSHEVPLISIVRDTLGDENPDNDRLRYLWMLTYTKPSFGQCLASAIPFLYSRVRDKRSAGKSVPPPVMDLAAAGCEVWDRFFWTGLQHLFLDSYGIPLKASTHTYRQNFSDYRKAHVARALALLSLYESETGAQSVFTPAETAEIQARLLLSDKVFGGIVDDINFQKVYEG